MSDDQVVRLLEEIRDLQRQHVANYQEALRNQTESIRLQQAGLRRVRWILAPRRCGAPLGGGNPGDPAVAAGRSALLKPRNGSEFPGSAGRMHEQSRPIPSLPVPDLRGEPAS